MLQILDLQHICNRYLQRHKPLYLNQIQQNCCRWQIITIYILLCRNRMQLPPLFLSDGKFDEYIPVVFPYRLIKRTRICIFRNTMGIYHRQNGILSGTMWRKGKRFLTHRAAFGSLWLRLAYQILTRRYFRVP